MEMVATMALDTNRVIAEDVTAQGQLLVKKNTQVTKEIIQKLNIYKIMGVLCYEPADFASSYYEKISLSKEFTRFKEAYHQNIIAYKVAVDSFVYNRVPFSYTDLMNIIHNLYNERLTTGKQLLTYINLITPSDDELPYSHGVNCALICRMFAKWLGFNQIDVDSLTIAGFIFDIGKNLLPADIIWKPSKLNNMEMDLMKTHAFLGYHQLSKTSVEPRILNAALQHHERCDGSGYPQGLKTNEIDDFAKLVAIVDMYEAMTSPRTYRVAMCPYKAISIFEQDFFQKYDIRFIQTFMTRISDELIGSRVKLNTGDEGEVVMTNRTSISRPIIKMDDGTMVDLSKVSTLSIDSII